MSRSVKLFCLLLACCCSIAFRADASSLNFVQNSSGNHEYGLQTSLPSGFGSGEFTLQFWMRPSNNFPIGSTSGGSQQLTNWTVEDNQPYSSWSWWWLGNFLLDGHNNDAFNNGTFSLQFYGGGRLRWDFGDGEVLTGGHRSIEVWPASSTPSLLDGNWHHVSCVRRWSGSSSADLELWIDGVRVAMATSGRRTNMWTSYWSQWNGYPRDQAGWFWGAEKQAAVGVLPQYEDYKGLVDELSFWNRAKTVAELRDNWSTRVAGTESGLLGVYRFDEGSGTTTCNSINGSNCISLYRTNSGNWSSSDAPVTVVNAPQPPSTPTGISATALSTSAIDVSWIDVANETGYSLERAASGGNFAPLATLNAGVTAFSDTGLSASTTYEYRVRASNAAGNSQYSSVASATTFTPTPVDPAPDAPENLSATAQSSSQIALSWSDVAFETSYTLERASDGVSFAPIASLAANAISHFDSGLEASTAYSYRLRASNGAGDSPYSSTATTSTLALQVQSPATVPQDLQATAISPDRIDLSWSDSDYETGYSIERSAGGSAFQAVGSVGAGVGAFSDTGLAASTLYSYRVRALGVYGDSDYSSIASATTPSPQQPAGPPAAPTDLSWQALNWRQITLYWSDNATNESGFSIERSSNNATWSVVATVPMNTTTFTDTGLYYSRNYYYRVRAYNESGYSNFTAAIRAWSW